MILLLIWWCPKTRKTTTVQRKLTVFEDCVVHVVMSSTTKNADSTTKMVVFDDFVVDVVVPQKHEK